MTTFAPMTWMSSAESLRDELISYADEGLMPELLEETKPKRIRQILGIWPAWAHRHQRPPGLAPNGEPWRTWLILGGRGAGKTRAGAEWVRGIVRGLEGFSPKAG